MLSPKKINIKIADINFTIKKLLKKLEPLKDNLKYRQELYNWAANPYLSGKKSQLSKRAQRYYGLLIKEKNKVLVLENKINNQKNEIKDLKNKLKEHIRVKKQKAEERKQIRKKEKEDKQKPKPKPLPIIPIDKVVRLLAKKKRYVNEEKQTLVQQPIFKIIELSQDELESLKYYIPNSNKLHIISHFNVNIKSYIDDAIKATFDNNQMISFGGVINGLYMIIKRITKPNGDTVYTVEVKYTKSTPVNKNSSSEELLNKLYIKAEDRGDSDSAFYWIGYRIAYNLRQNDILRPEVKTEMLAFAYTTSLKFHSISEVSTSTNKLCIYETFLHNINVRPLNYYRNKENKGELLKLLTNEGSEIYESVMNGFLIKSLELLTEKYRCTQYIFFFEGCESPLKISNGFVECISSELDDKLDDTKCFLYHREHKHVAPFIYKYDVSIVKLKTDIENKKIKTNNKFILNPKNNKSLNKIPKNILGFDAETYLNDECIAIPFTFTLYGRLNGNDVKKKFYGKNCLIDFCNFIDYISDKTKFNKNRPKKKIEKIYIYGFNNANFDNLLIFNQLHNNLPATKFQFTNSAIKFIKYTNINIFDISLFYKLGDLRTTCKEFKLEKEKGVFPYKFPNADNLDYIGECPELKYWNSESDRNEYLEKNGNNFNLKQYTLKYCLLDSELVYAMATLHLELTCGTINDRHYNVVNCPTSANLALKMFNQSFQPLGEGLSQSPDDIVIKERLAYKGGRTEVFKKHFSGDKDHPLYYYDINSSYPSSMVKEMPNKYISSNIVSPTILNYDDIVDHYLYNVIFTYEGNDKFFIQNLLVRHDKTHEVIAVKEHADYTYHWGCELKEAILNNNIITTNEIIKYTATNIFKEFAEYFYNERLKVKKTNAVLSQFYKTVLNSLYGKFGQKEFNKKKLCNNMSEMWNTINNDARLLVDYQIIGDKILFEYKEDNQEHESIGKLIRFSSYITSLGRCNLSAMMRDVGHEFVYYCDTDSVFTTKKPSDCFLSETELGKWKLDKPHIIEAYFISPKCYNITTIEDKNISASKGIKQSLMNKIDYINLHDKTKDTISKNSLMFFRTFENITIKDQERNIKVIDNKRIWDNNNSESFNNIDEWYNNKY
jgi:hypothetical protein